MLHVHLDRLLHQWSHLCVSIHAYRPTPSGVPVATKVSVAVVQREANQLVDHVVLVHVVVARGQFVGLALRVADEGVSRVGSSS